MTRKQELLVILRHRDGDDCQWCFIIIDFSLARDDDMAYSFDHIRKHAEGGDWSPGNLKLMHKKCNNEKSRWEQLQINWRGLDR